MTRMTEPTAQRTRRIRLGIDTGGTFTDVVAVDEDTGELATTKTPSTPADPADGFMAGHPQGPRPARGQRRGGQRGQPRHDGGDQPAAGGQGRQPRFHHHRGLRAHARDRPAVGAGRLRQQLLLGQAAEDRAGRPGPHRRRPAGPPTAARSGPSTRRARSRRPAFFAERGIATIGRVLPARLRQPRARAAHAARCWSGSTPRRPCRSRRRCCGSTASTSGPMTTLVDAAVKPSIRRYVANISHPARRVHLR